MQRQPVPQESQVTRKTSSLPYTANNRLVVELIQTMASVHLNTEEAELNEKSMADEEGNRIIYHLNRFI
jgi:hypothetical protein